MQFPVKSPISEVILIWNGALSIGFKGYYYILRTLSQFFITNFPAEARILRDVTKDIPPATKMYFLLLCAAQDHKNMLAFRALLSPTCLLVG